MPLVPDFPTLATAFSKLHQVASSVDFASRPVAAHTGTFVQRSVSGMCLNLHSTQRSRTFSSAGTRSQRLIAHRRPSAESRKVTHCREGCRHRL